jgi:hypothetical protein
VEQILGRLLTDPDFREQFFSPQFDSLLDQYALSEAERQAIIRSRSTFPRDQFQRLEVSLDPAISRAPLKVPAPADTLGSAAPPVPGASVVPK